MRKKEGARVTVGQLNIKVFGNDDNRWRRYFKSGTTVKSDPHTSYELMCWQYLTAGSSGTLLCNEYKLAAGFRNDPESGREEEVCPFSLLDHYTTLGRRSIFLTAQPNSFHYSFCRWDCQLLSFLASGYQCFQLCSFASGEFVLRAREGRLFRTTLFQAVNPGNVCLERQKKGRTRNFLSFPSFILPGLFSNS